MYSEVPGGKKNKQNYQCIDALIDESKALPNHHVKRRYKDSQPDLQVFMIGRERVVSSGAIKQERRENKDEREIRQTTTQVYWVNVAAFLKERPGQVLFSDKVNNECISVQVSRDISEYEVNEEDKQKMQMYREKGYFERFPNLKIYWDVPIELISLEEVLSPGYQKLVVFLLVLDVGRKKELMKGSIYLVVSEFQSFNPNIKKPPRGWPEGVVTTLK